MYQRRAHDRTTSNKSNSSSPLSCSHLASVVLLEVRSAGMLYCYSGYRYARRNVSYPKVAKLPGSIEPFTSAVFADKHRTSQPGRRSHALGRTSEIAAARLAHCQQEDDSVGMFHRGRPHLRHHRGGGDDYMLIVTA